MATTDPAGRSGLAARNLMPTVLLSTHELRKGLLPRLCARCGEPTDESVRITVPTPLSQAALGVAGPLCPPLFVLLARSVKRRSSAALPLCPPHAADWRWRDRLTSVTYLAAVCGSYLAAGVLLLLAPIDPLVPTLGYYFVWVGWVWPAVLLWTRTVRITKVTPWGVRLSAVDPAFVAAIREDRARDADPARLPFHGDVRDDYDDQPD